MTRANPSGSSHFKVALITGVTDRNVAALKVPVALMAFDILQDGTQEVTWRSLV